MGKACFCGPLDTEHSSMGGIVECGVSTDTKDSPRRVAIEKAQEELRQEYDVREERRRELEFLVKGGNPLDFKLGHVASLSVHSTSVTDQIAEQNVISEAKGSFAFDTSPHGDSVESSGRPGSSSCREANTADNLMLLDGDTSNIGGDKLVKRGTKRTITPQPELSLCNDGQISVKEVEDSGLFRLGAKSQAYARRRSKSGRDNANTVPVRTPPVPPLSSQRGDARGVVQEAENDDYDGSSIERPKPISSNGNDMLKNVPLNNPVVLEVGGVQAIHEGNHHEQKHEIKNNKADMLALEISSNNVSGNSQRTGGGQMPNVTAFAESLHSIPKEASSRTTSFPSKHSEIFREAHTPEKAGNSNSDKSMVDAHADDMEIEASVLHPAIQTARFSENEVDMNCTDTTKTVDEHPGRNDSLSMKIGQSSDEGLSNIGPGQLEGSSLLIDSSTPVQPEVSAAVKDEAEVCNNVVDTEKETCLATSDYNKVDKEAASDLDRNNKCSSALSGSDKLVSVDLPPASLREDMPNPLPSTNISVNNDNGVTKCSRNDTTITKKECEDSIMTKKEYDDSILRRARFIEVNIKRAGERALCNVSLEKKRKSHWEFVLEEMAWMSNDFMQERLWRSAAAAQMCYWIASSGRASFEEANVYRKQKSVARILSKGVVNFWRSAETLRTTSGEIPKALQVEKSKGLEEMKPAGIKAEKELGGESIEHEKSKWSHQSPIQSYALRFLEYNCNVSACLSLAEAPPTPERLNDFGILKVPAELSDTHLFYEVAPGAMHAYRESVEYQSVYNKRLVNTGHKEDYEPSTCDSVPDVHRENGYGDEGEAYSYLLPGTYDGGLASKSGHKKKQQMHQRMNGTRLYDNGIDPSYDPYLENKTGNQPFLSNGKRPPDFLSIPIKRIRTAARQRVASPFSAGVAGTPQFTSKTDASSGDTNSCQDDQSSLHGGFFPRKNADIESTVDFDKQLMYDGSEVSAKSKKKKKPKYPGHKAPQSVSESYTLMAGKKDYLKKRPEAYQFDPNGNTVNGHASKKIKLLHPAPDISLDALTPVGPLASPVASQMSNMVNPTKIIKIITNRDRGRKSKGLKMAAGHSGPGCPWSNFEDQALVVLVHDMDQNWELVSDALNSIVQLKCIYRRPDECKDRHKLLTDKSSGDGADSADDSGSSQHYQSTLPGIPKGSARQLFQRLQGPFEEETLKTHFEKIIFLGQRLHPCRRKGESQELKPINPLHTSHVLALSQVCPSNFSAGVLTPLDLCDTITSSPDILPVGYPGSHTNVLTLPNHHGSLGPTLPTSNMNARLPGSPGMVLGSSLSSPSTLNAPSRDAQRYGVPRPTSLQGDEQQRIQYNHMLNGRNLQQPGVSVPGVRMMSGANGMGMMTGLARCAPVVRPGFTRLGSPGMLNMVSPGNMLSSNGQSMQNSENLRPGAVTGPGNTMPRPRDPMQMLRPGQNLEEHRQMTVQEYQMQVAQGNSQAVNYSGTQFSNAGTSSPVQSFPVQQSQPNQMPQQVHMFGNTHHSHIRGANQSSPQHQAYVRLAKERHIQQGMMPQQQHPLSAAGTVPNVQNGSQMQPQSSASTAPSSHSHHKKQNPVQSPQDSSVLPNQPANSISNKQKKQQTQQQSRQNQQQRNQGSQQAKLMKSLGRGNVMQQNSPVDATQPSSSNATSNNQVSDRNMVQQGPAYFAGNKGLIPSVSQPGNQPKVYAAHVPQSPIQSSDIGVQGLVQSSPNQTLLAPHQAPVHSSSQLATQQQQQQRHMNPSHNNIQRLMMQQNRHMNTDSRIELPVDQVQPNQVILSTSIARSTDSGSPGVSSIQQRKQESPQDPTAVTSTSQLASSPQDTFIGNEASLSASNQGMLQRQMSGGVPIHGHVTGAQRQQQQGRQQHQTQQQHRPVVQGSVYSHPSNSGPG
ncbi:chromatin modification-related protein EAF1 B isoform X3 [Lolium perenne]|uniref:chromatin modification-related protein EAF1 B isoform X3 n=1 Tax=Lolium perenne TaxID=4522 RepID=UPI0021F6420C|nr:chromatin modification-related protein EAF1 B-like isoform X3 [Lolium perenne]